MLFARLISLLHIYCDPISLPSSSVCTNLILSCRLRSFTLSTSPHFMHPWLLALTLYGDMNKVSIISRNNLKRNGDEMAPQWFAWCNCLKATKYENNGFFLYIYQKKSHSFIWKAEKEEEDKYHHSVHPSMPFTFTKFTHTDTSKTCQ